jgi:hypothetical protein
MQMTIDLHEIAFMLLLCFYYTYIYIYKLYNPKYLKFEYHLCLYINITFPNAAIEY